MFDIIIVGGGAAGLSAAITARQKGKSVCVIRPKDNDSWIYKAEKISNYLGLPDISGEEMLAIFEKQAVEMGTEFKIGIVKQILPTGESFFASTGPDFVEGKKVIITTGVSQPRQLPGESRYVGRGVSYCGTCDGMLYKGKTIALIAENEESHEEMQFLSGVVGKIYLAPTKLHFSDLPENVEVMTQPMKEIDGTDLVDKVLFGDDWLQVDGVFIFRNTTAYSTLIPGLDTDGNFIKVNKKMETNIDGIYAAGDCTGKPLQIAKAAGEGNVAALSAMEGSFG